MIDRNRDGIADLSRSNVYYMPARYLTATNWVMSRIDELYWSLPFARARMLRDLLKLEDIEVGPRHVRALVARIGIVAICRKCNNSAPHPDHSIYAC
jgi:putative transposase